MVINMKNTLLLIFCLALLLQWGCSNTKKENNGELEFIPIERINGKYLIDRFDETKGYSYAETILVKNPPKDIGYAIGDMMINYREQYGIDFSNMNINKYIVSFYNYNSDTKTYLTQDYRNTWNGVTNSLGDEYKNEIGMLVLEKCDSIDNKWTQYIYIYIYKEEDDNGFDLIYRTDSCVSVIDNQFQRNGQPITYTPVQYDYKKKKLCKIPQK